MEKWVTSVDKSEKENSVTDSYGVEYSKDGLRLLSARHLTQSDYRVKDGVKVICEAAFMGVIILKHISLPDSVEVIGRGAFYHSEELEKIDMNHGLKLIESWAFSGCKKLDNVVLVSTLEKIEFPAFSRDNVMHLTCKTDRYVYYKRALYTPDRKTLCECFTRGTRFVIPEGTERMERYSLFSCKRLKKIYLPHSLKHIAGHCVLDFHSKVDEVYTAPNMKRRAEQLLIDMTHDWGKKEYKIYVAKDKNKPFEADKNNFRKFAFRKDFLGFRI
ncbi:MAG: leucine-rich repeat domain-containing protein [Bacteroidales bacterium]|nr:leucine-rich repeat domain-containing protein [Bacteroidales bacterium]